MPANLREQVDEDTVRLWRTPKADDPNHGPASREGILRRLEKGQSIRLQDQVNHPALFRTPDAGCARGAQSPERFKKSAAEGKLLTLNDQIAHLFPTPRASNGMTHPIREPGRIRDHRWRLEDYIAFFPTPKATDADHGGPRARDSRGNLSLPAAAALYPTPTCNDAKNNNPPSQRKENGRHSDQLNVVAGGSLNPEWVEWLMGFPVGWTDIGEMSRTSRA
jgi:hypothetical protein